LLPSVLNWGGNFGFRSNLSQKTAVFSLSVEKMPHFVYILLTVEAVNTLPFT
jgi:hypothetical protein